MGLSKIKSIDVDVLKAYLDIECAERDLVYQYMTNNNITTSEYPADTLEGKVLEALGIMTFEEVIRD